MMWQGLKEEHKNKFERKALKENENRRAQLKDKSGGSGGGGGGGGKPKEKSEPVKRPPASSSDEDASSDDEGRNHDFCDECGNGGALVPFFFCLFFACLFFFCDECGNGGAGVLRRLSGGLPCLLPQGLCRMCSLTVECVLLL